ALIGLPAPHRERVLAHLMQAHRANLGERRADPPEPAPALPVPVPVPVAQAPAELPPAPAPAPASAVALPPRAERPDARVSDWQSSDTHIGGLPTVPMALDDADQADAQLSGWLDSLRPGVRCKLYLQGRWTTAQLAWRSDNGEFFMFTSSLAGGMHSLTWRGLKRLRGGGLATDVAEPSAVQRAIGGLLQELGGR
ncbi:hypothetical protein DBR42_11850, partial [Pelomonas sp. HMWF004]